jgi:hypothetical protein
VRLVHAQVDLDLPRFQKMFVHLMTACGGADPACAAPAVRQTPVVRQ